MDHFHEFSPRVPDHNDFDISSNGVQARVESCVNGSLATPLEVPNDTTTAASAELPRIEAKAGARNDDFANDANDGLSGKEVECKNREPSTTSTTETTGRPNHSPDESSASVPGRRGGNKYREMAREFRLELALDQNNQVWVRVSTASGQQTFPLDSDVFACWLDRKLMDDKDQEESKAGLKHITDKFKSLAYEHEPIAMGNRFHQTGPREIWVNLANETGSAIRVSPDLEAGFEIVARPPFNLRKHASQKPLATPVGGGDPNEIFEHAPLLNERDRLIILTWAICAMLPGWPKPWPCPILMLLGTHGSGKTTLAKILRRLLDPATAEVLGQDRRGDFQLALLQQDVLILDNWDKIEQVLADTLCQAVSGGGALRRTLFTNFGVSNWSFQNALIITSAVQPTNRADLLQRCWPLELDSFGAYQTEERLVRAFLEAQPRVLGSLLTLLARVLQLLPTTDDSGVKRMADAHRIGRAVARVLGRVPEDFDRACQEMEYRQKRLALDQPLAQAAWLFARQQEKKKDNNLREWDGEPAKLLKLLHDVVKENGISRSAKSWPETAVGLGRQIKTLNATLLHHGVTITRPTRGNRRSVRVSYDEATDTLGGAL